MSCSNCSSQGSSFNVTTIYNSLCSQCASDCQESCLDSKCVKYTGPSLTCSGIVSGDSVELAIQKLDSKVCESTGDYSTYSYNCVAAPGTITTEAGFVNAITAAHCTLQANFNTFTGSTFVTYQQTVDTRFIAIEQPNKTCGSVGILASDSYSQILDKYCTKFVSIDNNLNLSSVNWSQCYTVVSPPSTIPQGFDAIIDQICQLKADVESASTSLPTFNNLGTCLLNPTASDSLVDTVNKIKTRLCQTPTFDINALSWGCVSKPSSITTDLQAAFQSILTRVDDYVKNKLTFSGDFLISQTNPSDICAGKTVSLAVSPNADRYVATNVADNTPGTLSQKLQAGAGVSLDDISVPGKIIISSAGTTDDKTVKASLTDPTSGFLDQKLNGVVSSSVSVYTDYNVGTGQIDVSAAINMYNFVNQVFDIIETNSELKERFCAIVSSCPSPCAPPQNVQAIYVSDGTTTTTSTTTTSTTSTTTTSTTTTSTTTTTTTPPILDDIYFGAKATGSFPTEGTILAGTLTQQNGANNVNIDWTPFNGSPQYCWVAIPDRVATSTKNKWYVDVLNNGNMGSPTDLFGAPTTVVVSGVNYLVWITNYQTQFTATCQLRNS